MHCVRATAGGSSAQHGDAYEAAAKQKRGVKRSATAGDASTAAIQVPARQLFSTRLKAAAAAAAAAASEATAVAESETTSALAPAAIPSARRSASSKRTAAAAAAVVPAPFATMSHRAMLHRDAADRCETVAHPGQRRLTMFSGPSDSMHGSSSSMTIVAAPAFKPGELHALDALAAAAAASEAEQDGTTELLWPITGTSDMLRHN
jgi:hypothetical protein